MKVYLFKWKEIWYIFFFWAMSTMKFCGYLTNIHFVVLLNCFIWICEWSYPISFDDTQLKKENIHKIHLYYRVLSICMFFSIDFIFSVLNLSDWNKFLNIIFNCYYFPPDGMLLLWIILLILLLMQLTMVSLKQLCTRLPEISLKLFDMWLNLLGHFYILK